ncbi:endo-1,4-beta-xylanase [Dactylosporangium sp. NPDC048998]|uniref:endo-1,4-beta-xylanase n=1 Tax=Dactylosporangium sp. NPDC048998 TaxID=3363976 RepID=UPI0037176E32
MPGVLMGLVKRYRQRSPRRHPVMIIATAIVLAGFVQGVARADDAVLLSSNFESGYTPWGTRGPVTLALSDEAHGGSHSLSVTGRTANWNGPATSATDLFRAGATYSVTGWVKLPAGTSGSTGIHFSVQRTPADGSGDSYDWIGDSTPTTASTWVKIGGSYTFPAGQSAATLYVEAEGATTAFLLDDVSVTGGPTTPPATVVSKVDFEDGTTGTWTQSGGGTGTLTVIPGPDGGKVLSVNNRNADYVGIQSPTGLFQAGKTYTLSMKARLAPGTAGSAGVRFVMKPQYEWIGNTTMTADGWTTLTADWTAPGSAPAGTDPTTLQLYIGTGNLDPNVPYTYLIDDVQITTQPSVVQDLTPIKDTVDFPVGVAIDSRETTGNPSQLLLKHFDQVTPENHFKPDAWYDADRKFRPSSDAIAIMNFARDNHLRVYGHTLVWYQQTPAWFFQDDQGNPLPADATGRAILTQRLHDHIFNVANWLATNYGKFGAGNPLVAFDVVNEVVADTAENADGLRRSEWYRILGESYIDLAFQFANQAFDVDHAASGADRPIKLFINDFNSEQGGKQDRYHALVQRLKTRNVPVDGVGHQFHLSQTTSISSLGAALDRFTDLPVVQAVTELDVTLATPVTQAEIIDQGYFYQDAFKVFRAHHLFSATVWGIDDARSWRSSQAPLLFDGQLQAKPAYYGIADPAHLPARLRTANVFGGDVALGASAFNAIEWQQLPPLPIGDGVGSFGLRWNADHLTALVTVAGDKADAIQFAYAGKELTFRKDGTGDVPGVVSGNGAGWRAVVHLPHSGVTQGGTGGLDVRVLSGGNVLGAWNSPGALGTLSYIEPLSYLQVVQARQAPSIDGDIDAAWADAKVVHTGKLQSGDSAGATADVRTLWQNDTLYVLAVVTDPHIDASSSNAYEQDSVELFIDPGNAKNGSYRAEDAQIRINVNNVHSFGTGDAAAQEARLRSATKLTATGYIVEAAVTLAGHGGIGTFQGLDFQVNDGTNGARTAVHSWAEPTGTGYQTTARWGVGNLVGPAVPAWSAATTYSSGDWVTYQGSFWTALWKTTNQAPGDPNGAWQQIATADDGATIWTPSRIFNKGDAVKYQGKTYVAEWWTRNQQPGDPNGPWKETATAPDGATIWTPSGIYNAGDIVVYQGKTYVAQWWTRNETPGTPNGPWKSAG